MEPLKWEHLLVGVVSEVVEGLCQLRRVPVGVANDTRVVLKELGPAKLNKLASASSCVGG